MSRIPPAVMRVFAGTWLAYAGFYLCRKNFSILMPALSTAMDFSKDQLATLVFAYSVAYAIGQFLNGTMADALGAKRIVLAGLLVSAGCNAAMASSWTGLVGSGALVGFAMLQIGNGLAQSAGWPGLLKITAQWFSVTSRGVMMAWWGTNLVVGGLAGTVLATWLVTGWPAAKLPALGWRLGALGPAIALCAVAIVFWFLVAERGERPQAERVDAAGAWKEVLSSPALRSIAASYFCLKLMRYSFLFWLPLYMVEKLHYGGAEAGYTSSIYELVGFAGVPIAGYLSDRVCHCRRFPVGSVMMFALAAACLVFPQLSAGGRLGNVIAIGLVGILTFGPDTLMAGAATQDAATDGTAATAGGFVNGVGSIGQLISPFLVSLTVRFAGWDGLFGVFVGVALVGAIALGLRWNNEVALAEASLSNA